MEDLPTSNINQSSAQPPRPAGRKSGTALYSKPNTAKARELLGMALSGGMETSLCAQCAQCARCGHVTHTTVFSLTQKHADHRLVEEALLALHCTKP